MVFPPTAPQTQRAAPEINRGDGALITAAHLRSQGAQARNERRDKALTTSIYTDVTEEVREFVKDIREEFKQPAPYMKRKISPAQVRAKFAAMTPTELIALSRKFGTRRVAQFAQNLRRGSK